MQLRLGVRTDEKALRLLAQRLSDAGSEIAVNESFGLSNVEQNFFFNNGLFIVCENNGEIRGFAGARSMQYDEETLDITSLLLEQDSKYQDLQHELISTILDFACAMGYRRVCLNSQKVSVAIPVLEYFQFQKIDTNWFKDLNGQTWPDTKR
jgi:hypothetical protein